MIFIPFFVFSAFSRRSTRYMTFIIRKKLTLLNFLKRKYKEGVRVRYTPCLRNITLRWKCLQATQGHFSVTKAFHGVYPSSRPALQSGARAGPGSPSA